MPTPPPILPPTPTPTPVTFLLAYGYCITLFNPKHTETLLIFVA
jgi:uncharacterized RDD family membrane protein YckC